MLKPKVLVLAGDGINCERETVLAFTLAGAQAQVIHVNDLLARPALLLDYQILAVPGGFSFGDDLGSGQILALKLKNRLHHELLEFVQKKGAVIGICNGLQVLAKLGLLPFADFSAGMSLVANTRGLEKMGFQNRWVSLQVNPQTVCPWVSLLKEKGQIDLPIRHGEGKVIFASGREGETLKLLGEQGQIVLTYQEDVNGSTAGIAGLCDPSGLIFGLMPHPEAFLFNHLHPELRHERKIKTDKGAGALIFDSIVNYLRQN